LRTNAPDAEIIGFDSGFFGHSLTGREAGNGGRFLAVNVGHDEGNYQAKDLAEAVARQVTRTTVSTNTNAPPDWRSYKVEFLLFKSLAPESIRR
jgi:hypothetical protein